MTLHETYARVIAARPDAAVPGLCWWNANQTWDYKDSMRWFTDDVAEALIFRHWIGLMGEDMNLCKSGDGTLYQVQDMIALPDCRKWQDSPIDALAAYLIATAKEKA